MVFYTIPYFFIKKAIKKILTEINKKQSRKLKNKSIKQIMGGDENE